MKFNIFWLAPFVLPFVIFTFIAAFGAMVDVKMDREFVAFMSLLFGMIVGFILSVGMTIEKVGEIYIGKKPD